MDRRCKRWKGRAMAVKKILVTGAGGFIGCHLGNYLGDQGFEVVGLDLHFPANGAGEGSPRFLAVTGDFRELGKMDELLRGVDVVFHLASAHLQVSLRESEYRDINVHSLPDLLEAARSNGVQRFVHCSSVGVFGNLSQWPAGEESPCRPQSIYGETKLAGENEVRKFYERTGFPVVIIRPAWVYGPGCPRTRKLYNALAKRRFFMIGKGENMRHPIFISDMTAAFSLAMKSEEAIGELFIIAGPMAITTREMVDAFCRVFKLPKPHIQLPYSVGLALARQAETISGWLKKEPMFSRRSLEFFDTNNAFDITKARNLLGFEPEVNFDAGLKASERWLINRN
jgi:dihydroflavonol-4-reductase